MLNLNENVISLAEFTRNLQYQNSLACTRRFAFPFFWDIALPEWKICDQSLWTTMLVQRFEHASHLVTRGSIPE